MTETTLLDVISELLQTNKSLLAKADCDELVLPKDVTVEELQEVVDWLLEAPFTEFNLFASRGLNYEELRRSEQLYGVTLTELKDYDKAAKKLRKYIRRKPKCLQSERRGKKKSMKD